jgi:hypothetical protein
LSLAVETETTLVYDPIESIEERSYEVTYPTNNTASEWIPLDQDEADTPGPAPATIRRIREDETLSTDQQSIDGRHAVVPADPGYVVLLAGARALLSERLDYYLAPMRNRTIAFANEERISEPWAVEETGGRTHSAWLSYKAVITGEGTPTVSDDPETGVNLRGGGVGPAGMVYGSAGEALTDTEEFLVSTLYVGDVQPDGAIPDPKVLNHVSHKLQGASVIEQRLSETIGAPRFITCGPKQARRIYVYTAGCRNHIHVVRVKANDLSSVEEATMSTSRSEGFSGSDFMPVDSTRADVGPIGQVPAPLVSDSGLVEVDDLFALENERWIAVVRRGTYDARMILGNGLEKVAATKIPLPEQVERIKAGVVRAGANNPTDILLLFPSFVSERAPILGVVDIDGQGNFLNDVEWIPFNLPDLEIGISVHSEFQDVIQRCPNWVDLILSSTGYFSDKALSASLYRIRVGATGARKISCLQKKIKFGLISQRKN